MAKISIKRPRIISKKFPEVNSTIDGVEKSLNDLVFTYSEHIDRTLQKKHIMMAASSIVLLIVLGSFISPRGKAESSVFYPDTCLGGWVNPQYAQGEQETTSNGDETQFTKHNSAILPKNTDAEMYCGNFKGKFDQTTKPTKIIVSLALTKGVDLLLEDTLESGVISATSSVSASSSIEVSSTTEQLLIAASTASSTQIVDPAISATSSTPQDAESSATSSATSTGPATATAIPSSPVKETASAISNAIDSVKDGIMNLFEKNKDSTPVTDTVVVPAPIPDPTPAPAPAADTPPTSYIPFVGDSLLSLFFQKVFAQETDATSVSLVTAPSTTEQVPPQVTEQVIPTPTEIAPVPVVGVSEEETVVSAAPTSTVEGTPLVTPPTESVLGQIISTSSTFFSTSSDATSTDNTSTTTIEIAETPAEENLFQNNFLEVFYTFDGVTWISLGELNEISMKYRTFEIPVTATTSWEDMSHLQVKIIAKKHDLDTPTVYLDAIKVEVLYETTLIHAHPDFARDTILKDETVGDMRIVTIVNSENKQEEIWYMYLEGTTTPAVVATSTDVEATSTRDTPPHAQDAILLQSTTTNATSTVGSTSTEATVANATTTAPRIKPVVQKNVWIKFEGSRKEGISSAVFAQEIRKLDEQKLLSEEEKIRQLPDFALDIIRRIKGTFLNAVIVQLQKDGKEELWTYDLEKGTEEKIDTGTSTSLSADSPLGVKDGYVFWLSGDSSKVYAYNMSTKEIQEQLLPAYDISKGERGEVVFPDISWKVIVSANGFSFFSESTGEVFSDDNGSIAEALRQKLNLDTVLDKEELSNLNLQVEEATTTP